jgi:hypothetical protein
LCRINEKQADTEKDLGKYGMCVKWGKNLTACAVKERRMEWLIMTP